MLLSSTLIFNYKQSLNIILFLIRLLIKINWKTKKSEKTTFGTTNVVFTVPSWQHYVISMHAFPPLPSHLPHSDHIKLSIGSVPPLCINAIHIITYNYNISCFSDSTFVYSHSLPTPSLLDAQCYTQRHSELALNTSNTSESFGDPYIGSPIAPCSSGKS